MSENNGGNPLDDEQDLWTIHINIGKSGKHHVRLDPPRERVHIFPDYNDGTREEIERRLSDGEDLMDILTDPDGNISF